MCAKDTLASAKEAWPSRRAEADGGGRRSRRRNANRSNSKRVGVAVPLDSAAAAVAVVVDAASEPRRKNEKMACPIKRWENKTKRDVRIGCDDGRKRTNNAQIIMETVGSVVAAASVAVVSVLRAAVKIIYTIHSHVCRDPVATTTTIV